jgi:hypothetical protein
MSVTLIKLRVYSFDASEPCTFIDEESQAKFNIPSGILVDRFNEEYLGKVNAKIGFLDA